MTEVKKEPRKQCSACKDFKLLSEFSLERKKPMGRQSRCKYCHAAGSKAYRETKKTEEMAK